MRSVALLRGVNVGGRNKVAMADLTKWLSDVGFSSVSTYIQSGNVVIEHSRADDVAHIVHQVIAERTGLDIKVLVRTALELREVAEGNPYADASPAQLHVSFLDHAPEAMVGAGIEPLEWSPEEFTVVGRAVYLYLPLGMGRSVMVPRLTMLKGATTRNWNTVLALNDLASR